MVHHNGTAEASNFLRALSVSVAERNKVKHISIHAHVIIYGHMCTEDIGAPNGIECVLEVISLFEASILLQDSNTSSSIMAEAPREMELKGMCAKTINTWK